MFNRIYPAFWRDIAQRKTDLGGNVAVINAKCASFDDLITKLRTHLQDELTYEQKSLVLSSNDLFTELKNVFKNKPEALELLEEIAHQANLFAWQQENFQTKKQKIPFVTVLYGGSEDIEGLELYCKLHPQELKAGNFNFDDLITLKENVSQKKHFLEPAPQQTNTTIFLAERWRTLEHVAIRRSIAKASFQTHFQTELTSPAAQDMRAALLKDSRHFFQNRIVLRRHLKRLEEYLDAFLYVKNNINIPEEVEVSFNFLIDELIDIMSQMRRRDESAAQPQPILCHNRDFNESAVIIVKHSEILNLDPAPYVYRAKKTRTVPYFITSKQLTTFYKNNKEFSLQKSDFSSEQIQSIYAEAHTHIEEQPAMLRSQPIEVPTTSQDISDQDTSESLSSSPTSYSSSTATNSTTTSDVDDAEMVEKEPIKEELQIEKDLSSSEENNTAANVGNFYGALVLKVGQEQAGLAFASFFTNLNNPTAQGNFLTVINTKVKPRLIATQTTHYKPQPSQNTQHAQQRPIQQKGFGGAKPAFFSGSKPSNGNKSHAQSHSDAPVSKSIESGMKVTRT